MSGKASTKAKNKYNAANYERISLVVPKGKKDIIKAYAEQQGESLNGFINRVIDEAMKQGSSEDKGEFVPFDEAAKLCDVDIKE